MNILTSVALATALTPIAANAAVVTLSSPQPKIHTVAAQRDAAVSHGMGGQTIVRSGSMNQLFPESTGG
jgi:hypothetical protein